ncbi:ATP-binding cassette domain-containing protein [Nocardia sp. NPDC046473]|uniref:ABC transporter ATP-binding protein n=1 Tax=Nocardia sp. NPDC046473 TaxID=3155733 RepID=UPI0033D6EEC3
MSDPALELDTQIDGATTSPQHGADVPPTGADSRAAGLGDGGAGQSVPVVVDQLSIRASTGLELFGPTSFQIAAGQITALTGPSGSGKTTLMRALLGQLPTGGSHSGSVSVAGHDVFELDLGARQRFRRTHVAYVGQDPGSALNPLMRVHGLLHEVARHVSRDTVIETLELVGLAAEHLRRRSGELSGGQQRRVALARALIRRTGVLILDEPLAGLHGALRTDIARLLTEIAAERSTAILLSGHDTVTVHAMADNVIELGTVVAVAPRGVDRRKGPPTAAPPLIDDSTKSDSPVGFPTRSAAASDAAGSPVSEQSVPVIDNSAEPESPAEFPVADTVSAGDAISVGDESRPGRVYGPADPRQDDPSAGTAVPLSLRAKGIGASIDDRAVLSGIDLDLAPSAALAIVGVSGAGKTTLARVIAGLHRSATGLLELHGAPIPITNRGRAANGSNGIQLVTQNPRSALNPRRTVAQTLGRPLRRIGGVPRRQLAQRVNELLASVELTPELAGRYPHELSGGQRQRVALARALAAEPAVLICDEITSALDHATATSIMTLLDRIKSDRAMALLVISHDMSLVAAHCPRMVVLEHGRIVESGETRAILANPAHTATRALLG